MRLIIEIYRSFAGYALTNTNQVYVRREAVDYGHELTAVPQLYPGLNETITMVNKDTSVRRAVSNRSSSIINAPIPVFCGRFI